MFAVSPPFRPVDARSAARRPRLAAEADDRAPEGVVQQLLRGSRRGVGVKMQSACERMRATAAGACRDPGGRWEAEIWGFHPKARSGCSGAKSLGQGESHGTPASGDLGVESLGVKFAVAGPPGH